MSTAAPLATATAGHQRLHAAVEARPMIPALVILVLITAGRLSGTVDSDVAWQLWIAGRLHAGANLYRDIVETNPPLWFWMALPIDRLAGMLQIRVEMVLIVTINVLVALSLAATARLVHSVPPAHRTLLLVYGALALAAMPWVHVGQREQIAMIGALPYAALIATRREGRAVPTLLAVAIGAGAGLGFALKHYFLLVPVLLELWLIARQRKRWRPYRPEALAMAAVGVLYAAAILSERDYLLNIVPLVGQAYGAFSAPGLSYLFGPFALVALAILSVLVLHAPILKKAPLSSALLIAAYAFAAGYFIQFKGWPYHAIPMLGCGSIALAALLAEAGTDLRLLRLGGPALLCLPFSLSASEALHPTLPSPDLLQAVDGLPPGTPVGFISEDTALAWSVTLQSRFAYPSRYNGFWMLKAVYDNEQRAPPDAGLTELGRRVVSQTVMDFRCMPPRRIIAVRSDQGPLRFFLRDPDFADLLGHYRLTSRSSLDVYDRITPVSFPHVGCIKGR